MTEEVSKLPKFNEIKFVQLKNIKLISETCDVSKLFIFKEIKEWQF